MPETILIAEDEREIADLVELYLTNENYVVHKFNTGRDAYACIEGAGDGIDLAILDIMLPDISGLELCRMIRDKYMYPVIMLTAMDAETDKITGLTLGADDYITKPFRPLEMVARVKAQLRRYKRYGGGAREESGVYSRAGLIVDTNAHEAALYGRPLTLTPTEFSILRILCERDGNVVSSEELFHELWGDEYYSKSNNTITVHIRHIREKMGDSAEKPSYIKTVWGVGYKIEK